MTLLPIFIFCVFTLFALWLALAPFLGGSDAGMRLEHLDEEVREIELLVTRREVLVKSLRELDFDRETAKISDEDYEKFRRRYESEAVRIMRRLDELHGGHDWQKRVDDQLEALLGRPPTLRASSDPPEADAAEAEAEADSADTDSVEPSAAEVEADAASDVSDDEEAAAVEASDADDLNESPAACGGCGEPLENDDKFCSQCGTPAAAPKPMPAAANEASA